MNKFMITFLNYLLIFPTTMKPTANRFSCFYKNVYEAYNSRESGQSFHSWGFPVGISSSVPAFFKAFMRIVAHGLVYFKDPVIFRRVKELMLYWSSCKRAAYQAIHKHDLKNNDIKVYCKKDYSQYLNVRYIADAVCEANKITQEHSLFGGKKLWNKFLKGHISKKKWIHSRNNTLYSRGEKSHIGNPNIRIVGNQLWINGGMRFGCWVDGSYNRSEPQINLRRRKAPLKICYLLLIDFLNLARKFYG
jgi:hypothetical protein